MNKIRRLRLKKELSISELAKEVKIPETVLSEFESGECWPIMYNLDLDVTECLSIAYEEIKNRKGKMVNGTFIKESDL
ncbi:helix-turn-helix domain-containing protein [Streptococcus salivarius]|uniref:helix-turn-helix domain-containing protein n=1 Tax=Streptococcus salivarius TaxID=1304 RepID=UPI003A521412